MNKNTNLTTQNTLGGGGRFLAKNKLVWIISSIIVFITAFSLLLVFLLPNVSKTEDLNALSSSTTYYKSGSSFYTLTSSVQHYKCTNSKHSGTNDYTTSSVSGTCYKTSGYYYDCGSCGGTGSKSTTTTSTCGSCGGSGSKTSSCGTCSGSGQVVTGYGSHDLTWNLKCKYCGGLFANGVMGGTCTHNKKYGTCSSCGGSGSKTSSCGSCGGDGKVSSTTTTSCTTCGGDGERYKSGSSYSHSISKSHILYTYTNIDTGATATSQSTYTTATGYTITYNANGGSGSMSSQYFLHGHSQALTANAYTKTGYDFKGWNTSSTATSATYTNSQAVTSVTTGSSATLYAVWSASSYTVSFNTDGGSACSNISVTYNSTYGTLPTPTKSGYEFTGWHLNSATGTTVTSSTTVTTASNHTLYASWELCEFTLTYNYNGATGGNNTASKKVIYSQTYGDLPTPSRTDYIFEGWYLDSAFTTAVTSSTTVNTKADHTIYAKWSRNNVSVFATAGGEVRIIGFDTTNSSTSVSLKAMPYTGYKFLSWSASGGADLSSYTSAEVTIPFNLIQGKTVIANFATSTGSTNVSTFAGEANDIVMCVEQGGQIHVYGHDTTDTNARYAIKYIDPNYKFVGWAEYGSDTIISTKETVEFALATYKGKTLIAKFELNNANINTDLNN